MSTYQWILDLPRRVGHTTAACGGGSGRVVVVPTQNEAERVARACGVQTAALYQPHKLEGREVPVVFDVEAVKCIVSDLENKIEGLVEERDELQTWAMGLQERQDIRASLEAIAKRLL